MAQKTIGGMAGQQRVFREPHGRRRTMAKPFFRHKGRTAPAAFIDAGAANSNTIHDNGGVMRRQFFAAEGCKKLILAIAGDASDAQHLTGAEFKADPVQRNAMRVLRRERQRRDRQPHRALRFDHIMADGHHIAAHHHAREACRGFRARVAMRHHLAAAQNGRGFANAPHLFQLVGDVEH